MNKTLVLPLLFLAGCAVQPDYKRPAVEMPDAWKQASENSAKDGNWWRVYGDPALEKLLEEAFAHNSNLLLAAARGAGGADARPAPRSGSPACVTKTAWPASST